MQTPQISRPPSKGKAGYIVALAGSALSILSFLILPFISVSLPLVGNYSYSLLSIVQLAQSTQTSLQQYGGSLGSGSTSTSSMNAQISLGIVLLWLSLVVTVIACIIALIFTIRARSRALAGAITLILLGLIGAAFFLVMIIGITSYINTSSHGLINGFQYIGIGAWVCVLGMIATLIGGIVAITSRPRAGVSDMPAYGYANVPQQPQYPTNSYPQYSQQPPSYQNYPSQQYSQPQQPSQYPSQPSSPSYPQQQPQYPQQPSSPSYPQQPQQYPQQPSSPSYPQQQPQYPQQPTQW